MTISADDQERIRRLEHDLRAYGRLATLWSLAAVALFCWLMAVVISGVKW